jgi:hypothetical protein
MITTYGTSQTDTLNKYWYQRFLTYIPDWLQAILYDTKVRVQSTRQDTGIKRFVLSQVEEQITSTKMSGQNSRA